MQTILLQLLLQVVLIALNAVFACAEIAVLSVNETRLEKLAEDGNRKAVRLRRLTSQPAKFLATIQVAITLSGFLGSAMAAENFSEYLVNWLVSLGVTIPRGTLDAISVVLITIVLSYITLVFGELVPKRLAMKKSEALALGMSGMISGISKIFAPLVWLLTVSVNGVLRLLGVDPNAEEEQVSEEEIRMMVDAGGEHGTIDREEQHFIQNVFEFDDLTAGEISTHRTEIAMLWMDETPEQWAETIRTSRHSMYPVCQESVDQVIGVLNTKDYFRLADHSRETILAQAVKPAYFVPESVKADVLFRNMRNRRIHFAVVLDEYGGLSGIITIYDLLEQGVYDVPTFRERMEKVKDRISLLDREISSLQRSIRAAQQTDPEVLAARIRAVLDAYQESDPAHRNALLRSVFDVVWYTKEKKTKPTDFRLQFDLNPN